MKLAKPFPVLMLLLSAVFWGCETKFAKGQAVSLEKSAEFFQGTEEWRSEEPARVLPRGKVVKIVRIIDGCPTFELCPTCDQLHKENPHKESPNYVPREKELRIYPMPWEEPCYLFEVDGEVGFLKVDKEGGTFGRISEDNLKSQ